MCVCLEAGSTERSALMQFTSRNFALVLFTLRPRCQVHGLYSSCFPPLLISHTLNTTHTHTCSRLIHPPGIALHPLLPSMLPVTKILPRQPIACSRNLIAFPQDVFFLPELLDSVCANRHLHHNNPTPQIEPLEGICYFLSAVIEMHPFKHMVQKRQGILAARGVRTVDYTGASYHSYAECSNLIGQEVCNSCYDTVFLTQRQITGLFTLILVLMRYRFYSND